MRESPSSAIELEAVTLRYPHGVTALDHVSLSIVAGERVCVLGANGSGKSTLAMVCCGLLAPDEGSVSLVGNACCADGQVDLAAYREARRELGLVFQNPDDQIVTTVVAEDVAFGPENLGVAPDEIGRRVERELHRVALQELADADPSRLSGGQKQRVAIAGALAMRPRVLVFDEPGALLDMRGRRSIMAVMGKLAAEGVAVVHVTHFMDEALAADRVVVMEHGRIALMGTPEEVFASADGLRGLGLERPFAARLSERLRDRGLDVPWTCDEAELEAAVARAAQAAHGEHTDDARTDGAPAASDVPGKAPTQGASTESVVSVRNVSYAYGTADDGRRGRKTLDGVSLEVPAGSTLAIVGQTGSGKSTLLRLICALEAPDAGEVVVAGVPTARKRDRRRLHGRIGFVMQRPERQLFAQTVREDVSFGPRNRGLPTDEVARRCDEALGIVGLADKADASPFELSGGQQRLCAIAGILAMRPRLLVLDEPTAGLDPRGRAELMRILASVREGGATIVQVTHSMDDAARCDRVVVLDCSHVIMAGRPREVFAARHGQELREVGLGMPRSLEVARALEGAGMACLGEPLGIDELADAIARACGKGTA